jgi:molybdate transport system ATP-binding protein
MPDLIKLTNTLCFINEGQVAGHGEYNDLLKKQPTTEMFGSGSVVNSVTMKVASVHPEKGLAVLSRESNNRTITIKCEKCKEGYKPGQELKVFINADDIALSAKKLTNITVQNQLEGSVVEVIENDATRLCIIDVGFRLVVEITLESQQRMNIVAGRKIWCLFKSVAIDVAV